MTAPFEDDMRMREKGEREREREETRVNILTQGDRATVLDISVIIWVTSGDDATLTTGTLLLVLSAGNREAPTIVTPSL